MDSVRQNFAMSMYAEEDFLERALRDLRVEDRVVSDAEFNHFFPGNVMDGEPMLSTA